MSTNTLKTRIRHAYKTEAEWASSNPVLLAGEVAYSSDKNNKYKIGDGTSTWSDLVYANPVSNIPFIVGTQTATTGTWTGTTSEISSLVDGQTIRYWLPYNGNGNATLNLTLSTGTATGAIACYWNGTTRLTTHYTAGTIITLTYRANVSIAGSSTKYTGWWAEADFNSNTKNTAGSTNTSSKIFLIGATSQATSPTTYSHDTAYVGTNGCLYSNSTRVVSELVSTNEPTNQLTGDYWLLEY